MNLQFCKEKLEASEVFKFFKKTNPEAYLSSAFFTLTITDKSLDIEKQLDYFNKDKFAVFSLCDNIILKEEDAAKHNDPEKLGDSELDINKLPEIAGKLLQENQIKEKLIKIIAILSSQENKILWNLNCITASMSVIKIKLDDSGKSLAFDKVNLMDFVKRD